MQILQNFKLVSQVLCVILIIMLLCFGLQLGTIYLNFYYFEEVVLGSTLAILNKQFKAEIKSFSFSSKLLIEKYQQREKKRLESKSLVSPEQCLNKIFSKYSGQCSMCYGIINSNIDAQKSNYEKYLQIASLYSVIFFMADNSFDILFAGTPKESFIALWPQQGVFPTSIDLQTRPWYQLEYNQSNTSELYSTHFTQPYIHVAFKSITVSHTQALYDKDFSRIGVVTIQLNFSTSFPSFLQNNTNIKGYILDENFNILQSDGQSASVSTFFNQNITGFDESNTDIVKAYLQNGETVQSCQKLNKQLLCLKDVHQQEFIVEASRLSFYNQIFVLVLDPASDLQILEQRQNNLSQQIDLKIQLIVFQTVVPYLSFLIFSMIIIYNITSRISKIILKAQTYIYKDNSQVFKFLHLNVLKVQQKISLNMLEKLELAFANLNDKIMNSKNINPYCLQMINIDAYPKRIMKLRQYWHYLILKLENQKSSIPKLTIRKIITESNRKHPQTS